MGQYSSVSYEVNGTFQKRWGRRSVGRMWVFWETRLKMGGLYSKHPRIRSVFYLKKSLICNYEEIQT